MAKSKGRAELERVVGQELGRELSARTILFHQALADRVGITATDMKCLDYIDRSNDVTPGDLARLTGLTTGAITAALDRLEKSGLAKRERSQSDRRKVFVRVQKSARMKAVYAAYGQLSRGMQTVVEGFSLHELEAIQRFVTECIELLRSVTNISLG